MNHAHQTKTTNLLDGKCNCEGCKRKELHEKIKSLDAGKTITFASCEGNFEITRNEKGFELKTTSPEASKVFTLWLESAGAVPSWMIS